MKILEKPYFPKLHKTEYPFYVCNTYYYVQIYYDHSVTFDSLVTLVGGVKICIQALLWCEFFLIKGNIFLISFILFSSSIFCNIIVTFPFIYVNFVILICIFMHKLIQIFKNENCRKHHF